MSTVLALLLLFPLAGALFQVLLGGRVGRQAAEFAACAAPAAALAMALAAFARGPSPAVQTLYQWIQVGTFSAAADVRYDGLAAVMALMVTFVASLITLYSVRFMGEESDYRRFFCLLNLFVFCMLVIVLADNLLFLFLGWEGVGFCSYALIGFWYEDAANATAGRKAFLLTRIGDLGFVGALALLFATGSGLNISLLNAEAPGMAAGTALLLGLLFFWAATGKSAQLPLLVWLPDAMAGPTPVSALIHAATMVTAGVYLLARLFPLLAQAPAVLQVIALAGSVTALYGAGSALVQTDIKRVLAYSTISQVGYMFLGIGAGDPAGGIFHLLTHAFFKSLLFLAAGCVIHALHGEHDILRMGRHLRQGLPAVFLLFVAGALALGGVPPAAGYVSKGRILAAAFQPGSPFALGVWACAVLAAFLTTLYAFRLVLLVFTGTPAGEEPRRLQPLPKLMTSTLWPLAVLSVVAGWGDLPFLHAGTGWVASRLALTPGSGPGPVPGRHLEWGMAAGEALLALAGMVLAYVLYGPQDRFGLRGETPLGHRLTACLRSGLGLDRLYAVLFVRPYIRAAGFFWQRLDQRVLDRTVVAGARLFPTIAAGIRGWSTGRVTTSLAMLLVGLTVILILLTL